MLTCNHSSLIVILYSVLACCAGEGVEDGEPDSGPIFMLEPPSSILIKSHVGSMISCSAYGKPTPTLSWLTADGSTLQDIPGLIRIHTNNSLEFLPFSGEIESSIHRSSYRCSASNIYGTVVSRRVHIKTVKVDKYASYNVELLNTVVMEGNTAVFTCDIMPSFVRPYVSIISWSLNGRTITHNGRHLVTDSSLLYYNTTLSDSGATVKCLTVNKLLPEIRKESRVSMLTVIGSVVESAPSVEYNLENVISVKVGQNITLPCVAHGYPMPTCTWYHNNKKVNGSTSVAMKMGNLHIISVAAEHSGLYRCNISNKYGWSTITTNLVVNEMLSAQMLPRTQTIDAGLMAEFRCQVSGGPVKQVTWYRNGHELQQSDNLRTGEGNSLQIVSVSRLNVGMYQCLVSSNTDNVQDSAQLHLGLSQPVIHDITSDMYKHPESSVSLRCRVYGNPIPDIVWQLADMSVINTSDGRVKVGYYLNEEGDMISYVNMTKLQVTDGGRYTCLASNTVGSQNRTVTLNVYGSPVVRPMTNKTIVANSSYTVRCHVSGYPIDSIYWAKDGGRLRSDHKQTVTPDGVLTINQVEKGDAGIYNCTANSASVTSSAILHLRVITRPILQTIYFPALTQGDPYTVVCQVKQGDQPIQLIWYKNGQLITTNNNPNIQIKTSDSLSSMSFLSVQLNDIGNYSCTATNAAGSTTSTAALSEVNVKPYWIEKPRDSSVRFRHDAMISCRAGGSPNPSVTWKKAVDDAVGSEYVEINVTWVDKYQILSNGSLLVKQADRDDSGFFLCHVNNEVGTGISQSAQLIVNVPATFANRRATVKAKVGESISLKCEALGDHPLYVSWSYKGPQDVDWSPELKEDNSSLGNELTPDGIISTLTLTPVARSDSGKYICSAKNQYGHSTKLIQFISQEPPNAVDKLTVQEVTGRSVTLSWSLVDDGNSPVSSYVVYYTADDWLGQPFEQTSTIEHITLLDLIPATQYKIHVTAINDIGEGKASIEITQMTDEDPPSTAPSDVSAVPQSPSQLTVHWQPVNKDSLNGELLGYKLWYRKLQSEGDYSVITITNTTSTSYTLTRLNVNTSYVCAVAAFNKKGFGPRSQPVAALTYEVVPYDAPQNVTVSVLRNNIHVVWTQPVLARMYGKITGYKVIYHSVNQEQDETDELVMDTGKTTLILSNLKVNTRYSVQALAYTTFGNGVRSEATLVTTPPAAPAVIKSIRCSPYNSSSVMVSWLKPELPNGNIQLYEIVVESGSREIAHVTITYPNIKTHFLVTDLSEGQNYSFRVRAKNKDTDYSEYSNRVTASPVANAAPSLLLIDPVILVRYHTNLLLDCPVAADPIPTIEWSLPSGKAVPTHFLVLPNGTLSMQNVLREDSGELICTATNIHGTVTHSAQVKVQARPDPPQLRLLSVSATRVQVSWISSDNGGFNISGWSLEVSNGSRHHTEEITANQRSHWLTNLNCSQHYQLRLKAINHEGSSDFSNSLTITTQGTVPHLPSDTAKALLNKYATSTELVLDSGWFESNGCPISHFTVEYKRENSDEKTVSLSRIAAAQTDIVIDGLQPAQWYSVQVSAYNSVGSYAVSLLASTLTVEGNTISPQHQLVIKKPSIEDTGSNMLTVLVSVAIICLVSLLASIICVIYIKRRRRSIKYKKRSKSHQSMFSDISDMDPHLAIRSRFNLPRETISGDSRSWLLNHQQYNGQKRDSNSSQTNDKHCDDDYEDCTPTLSYTKARKAQLTNCPCGHSTLRTDCVYCLESQSQHLMGSKADLKDDSLYGKDLKEYDILMVNACDLEFPPPPAEVLSAYNPDESAQCGVESQHMTGDFITQTANDNPAAMWNRPSTTPGVCRGYTPRPLTNCASGALSSLLTLSSNHDELLMAYHNSKMNPISLTEPSCSCPSSDATTEPGIRHFTQSPPRPDETRQAVCEVPIYHCTLPEDVHCHMLDQSSDTAAEYEPHRQKTKSLGSNTPHRKAYKRKLRRPRHLCPFRDGSDDVSTAANSDDCENHGSVFGSDSYSSSTSDKGYGSRNQSQKRRVTPHFSSNPHYSCNLHNCLSNSSQLKATQAVAEEEDTHALVDTAAQTGETTPPSAIRQNKLQSQTDITSQNQSQVKILDRYYRTVSDRTCDTLDVYTDDYTIV